jgi:hypothetical protein
MESPPLSTCEQESDSGSRRPQFPSSSETQIKTRGETVDDRTFYERFFNAVGRELRAP